MAADTLQTSAVCDLKELSRAFDAACRELDIERVSMFPSVSSSSNARCGLRARTMPGPATVSIHNDCDMLRQASRLERLIDRAFVRSQFVDAQGSWRIQRTRLMIWASCGGRLQLEFTLFERRRLLV